MRPVTAHSQRARLPWCCPPTVWAHRVHREAGPGGGAKPDAAAGRDGGGAVAVVVDAEVTGLLMMGALSPGLKRHSVSLFEGAAPLHAQCCLSSGGVCIGSGFHTAHPRLRLRVHAVQAGG